ncbi:MAG: dihydrofolate reductase family protein, partial [Spirochaetales bacterium]|nr:dihydrofolate reductase family protein [Spirochaetales bacterium]
MSNQYKIDFPADKIKLNRIYQSKDSKYINHQKDTYKKTEEVYGNFSFPALPATRTYTLGSFVQSIDGKIAFPESPDGTLVARGNKKDDQGALADYWILNMLRSVCDAVLMGDSTIAKEPALTGHIYDSDLETSRIEEGKSGVPLHVIVSGDGSNFPLDHRIVQNSDIPLLIVTTEEGKKVLKESLGSSFIDFNNAATTALTNNIKGIVSMGKARCINLTELLQFLKALGIDTMLIESPTFLVSLMRDTLLDELYLNTSSVFIGGEALSLGKRMDSFTLNNHPHCKVISIHSHSDYFFYTRYRMEYK